MNSRRRQPLPSLECLEGRRLLTTVTLSDRGLAFTSTMEYASGYAEAVSDQMLDIEFSSDKDESVLMQLPNYVVVTGVTAYGPDGQTLDSWENLAEPWQKIDQVSSWIAGRTSGLQGMHRVHVEFTQQLLIDSPVYVSVQSYFGVLTIDLGDSQTTDLINLELVPTRDTELSFDAWIKQGDVEAKGTAVNGPWTISYSELTQSTNEPVRERIESSAFRLPSPKIGDIEPNFYAGVWISYESTTGRLIVRSPEESPIVAIEITNNEGLFVGPTPPTQGDNPFNVYVPNKVFALYLPPHGRSYFDFGPVLPTGLTRDDITSKLKIDGAYQGGGGLQSIVFSVDGDVPFEQAVKKIVRVPPGESIASYADTTIELQPGSMTQVHVAYHWDPSASTLAMPSLTPYASIQYRYSVPDELQSLIRDDWQTLMYLEPCSDECTAVGVLPNDLATLELRVENASLESPLTILSLKRKDEHFNKTFRFTIDVSQDEIVSIQTRYYKDTITVRDENEQIISTLNGYFRLGGSQPGSTRFYLDLVPASPLLSLSATRYDRLPMDLTGEVHSRSGEITLYLPDAIDQRSCDLSEVTWDGPDLLDWQVSNATATFHFVGPVEQLNYTLQFPPNACRMMTGDWLTGGDYTVDYVPPKIASSSFETDEAFPSVGSSAVLYFNEHVSYGGDWDNMASVRNTMTNDVAKLEDIDFSYAYEGVRLVLPPLPAGEYELAIQGLTIYDGNNNPLDLKGQVFTFSVADDVAVSVFDIDRNHIVDPRDFWLFSSDLWSANDPAFDLSRDGQFNEQDLDEWILQSSVFPVGDLTLDGVFDETDLEWLSFIPLDSPATRRSGDFDGDGLYTTADLTLAMQGGLAKLDSEEGI